MIYIKIIGGVLTMIAIVVSLAVVVLVIQENKDRQD